jgi:integrase
LRYQVEGKKVHKSTGLRAIERNRKKAEAIEIKEHEALSLERRFNVRQRENKSFPEAAAEFQKWLESEYGGTLNTIEAYRAALNHCRRFFKDRIVSSIDCGDVEQFKVERTSVAKPMTVTMSLLVLSKFFNYCKKRHWCSENPADDVSWPSTRNSGRIRVIDYDEEKRYLEAVGDDQDLRDFVVVLLNHGLRPNEILHVRKEAVRLDLGQFVIQKGKTASARRTVGLTPETLAIFERRMENASEWLFPRPDNPANHVPLVTLEHRHRIVRYRTGIEFIFYDLRHTFATRLLEGGASAVVVAKLLGHVDLATVHKYLHPADAMVIDAMKAYSASRQLKLAS